MLPKISSFPLPRSLLRPPPSCRRALGTAKAPTKDVVAAPSERPSKRVTIHSLAKMKQDKTPITMVTAYDFPSAVHVDVADIDVLLCGDSVGMVNSGHDTTLPVTLDDMVRHCQAVSRGCRRPLLVGDLPFGSYEIDPKKAFESAARLLKEGNMDAVKMEGGRERAESVRATVRGGIAVMGHVGLTPQSFSAMGGFRYQGRTAKQAIRVLEDALAIQDAGAFALVIECVPPGVAAEITRSLEIPTIGIGSGQYCDGQVLVYHDLLGMMMHPWHAAQALKFCKQYSNVGAVINKALAEYRDDVKARRFPGEEYAPYTIPPSELEVFVGEAERRRAARAAGTSQESQPTSVGDYGGSEALYGGNEAKNSTHMSKRK